MTDNELIENVLKEKKARIESLKGEKFLIYGELTIKFTTLEMKKGIVYICLKNEKVAVIR